MKNLLLSQFDLNQRLYGNVLDGFTNEETNQRLNGDTNINHVKYIAGHLLNAQYTLANIAGADYEAKWNDLFAGLRQTKARDDITYPDIEIIKGEWNKLYELTRPGLESLTETDLERRLLMNPLKPWVKCGLSSTITKPTILDKSGFWEEASEKKRWAMNKCITILGWTNIRIIRQSALFNYEPTHEYDKQWELMKGDLLIDGELLWFYILWGTPGGSNVAWGDWQHFVAYVAILNWFVPASFIPAIGWISTVAEVIITIGLLIGWKLQWFSLAAGILLLLFALAMTFSIGVKTALDTSVFAASASAFLLAATFQPNQSKNTPS